MATGVVRRAGALVLFVVTNADPGTAGTPNSLGLPDGRIPFSRCFMVGLFIATSSRLGMPLIFKGDLT